MYVCMYVCVCVCACVYVYLRVFENRVLRRIFGSKTDEKTRRVEKTT